MSATAAQITANRLNAEFSTGPITPEGIDNSKFNALRHGLTAVQVVIKGEDPAAYDELRKSLIDAWEPQSEIDAMLVEQLAQAWWRKLRVQRVEARIIEEFGLDACYIDPKASKVYNNFIRHRNAIERAWNHAFTQLERIAKARQKRENDESDFAYLRMPLPGYDGIGSVLSDDDQATVDCPSYAAKTSFASPSATSCP